MRYDYPEIIQCPSCKAQKYRKVLLSGSSSGERRYTDGMVFAPNLPRQPRFAVCDKCEACFKITEKEIIGKGDSIFMKSHGAAISDMPAEDLIEAIETGLVNASKEGSKAWKADMTELRILLWQAFNDNVRGYDDEDEFPVEPWDSEYEQEIYEENCRELLALCADDDGDEMLLMRAELFCNLGEFEQCRLELDKIKNSDKLGDYIAAISRACEQKSRNTKKLG